jgi:hypothetical protein
LGLGNGKVVLLDLVGAVAAARVLLHGL